MHHTVQLPPEAKLTQSILEQNHSLKIYSNSLLKFHFYSLIQSKKKVKIGKERKREKKKTNNQRVFILR